VIATMSDGYTTKTEIDRRRVLKGGAIAAALVAAGLAPPGRARAAWNRAAFQSASIQEALAALGAGPPARSGDVQIVAADIADNGAVVPVQIVSRLPGTGRIALFVENNPNLLAAVFEIGPDLIADISTRIKMMQTSQVVAVVWAGGRIFSAAREIKVTLGGCGS
jgi:sulfur-oxidizing protein SoxY